MQGYVVIRHPADVPNKMYNISPTKLYESRQEAESEAYRLAEHNPGVRFMTAAIGTVFCGVVRVSTRYDLS